MPGKLRTSCRSTDLASDERFSTASGRICIELCEGQGTQTPSLAPRAPPSLALKAELPTLRRSGTFYFALTRTKMENLTDRVTVLLRSRPGTLSRTTGRASD